LRQWILQVVAAYGYLGIFLMIALENVFPPIPSEIILTFGGFMAAVTRMNTFGVVTAATAGAMVGAAVLYRIGRVLGRLRTEALVARWGRVLRIRQQDVDRALDWFSRYRGKTVFLCRMVPLLRSLISIPAGMAQMPVGRFLLLTALGSAIWNTLLVSAGVLLGERWEEILGFLHTYSAVTCAVLALCCIGGVLWLLLRRRRV